MHIVIEQYPFDEISIIVDPSDTISSLKERFMDEFFLSRKELKKCLLVVDSRDCFHGEPIPFLDNAKDLFEADDSTTLRDLGVKDGDNLRLGYREPLTIYAISRMVLGIGIEDGNKIEVDCYDTIQSLKDKIRRATGKPINRGNFPSILFTKSAKQRSLLSFGFYNIHPQEWKEHMLYLRPRNYMHPSIPKIREAPKKKQQRKVISKSKARVQHKKDQEEFDDDEVDSPNDFYVIRPGARLPSDRKVQIFVKIPNLSFHLPIHANIHLNVAVLKNDIITCCKSYAEIDFPDYVMNGRFDLFRNNCRLHNYDPFSIYNVGNTKELLLQLYYDISFHIEVIFSTHQYKVYVKCSDTVARLKEKLQHVTGLPKKYQRIFYKGRCLDNDECRLIYYGINELGDKSFRFPMCLHRVPHLEEEEVEENFTTTPEIEVPNDIMALVVEKYTKGCQVQIIESITEPPLSVQVDGSSYHYHGKHEEQVDLLAPELVPDQSGPVNEPPQDEDYVAKDSGDMTSPEPEERKLEADAEGQQNRKKHKLPRRGYVNPRGGGRMAYPNGGRGGESYQNMPGTSTTRWGITRGTITTMRGGRSRGSSLYDDYGAVPEV